MNILDMQQVAATIAQPLTSLESINGYTVTSTQAMEEVSIYKDLSAQLIELEKTTDYNVDLVAPIRKVAQKMYVKFEEKAELLMRCEWLEDMKLIEKELPSIDSLEKVQQFQRKLSYVQTCPLKNELEPKLEQLEAISSKEKILSTKDQLVEDIFAIGNETFINLGTAGREYIIEEVLKEKVSVELAIAKAEALELKVEAAKQASSVEELKTILQALPLSKLKEVPSNYEAEVLQKLLSEANWNGLFHLDRLIHQYTEMVNKQHNPVQEGVLDTLVISEKVKEQLGIQQVQN